MSSSGGTDAVASTKVKCFGEQRSQKRKGEGDLHKIHSHDQGKRLPWGGKQVQPRRHIEDGN